MYLLETPHKIYVSSLILHFYKFLMYLILLICVAIISVLLILLWVCKATHIDAYHVIQQMDKFIIQLLTNAIVFLVTILHQLLTNFVVHALEIYVLLVDLQHHPDVCHVLMVHNKFYWDIAFVNLDTLKQIINVF